MGKPAVLFALAVLGLMLATVSAVFFLSWDFAMSPASDEKRDVIYEVVPGKAFNTVAKDLELSGVVKNAAAFSLYARVLGQRGKLKAGEYQLSTTMTPSEVLSVVTSGRSVARAFTVAEGWNIYEIASVYERGHFGTAADFMTAVRDRSLAQELLGEPLDTLEGYLFPETYQITKFMNARDVVTAMVRRFQASFDSIKSSMPPGWTRHQIVTLASIVEKETGATGERPVIASVFHNRLAKRMKLQTDPTIIYGIAAETGQVPRNISKADLLRPSRYNTYVIDGLPPGPISNPGLDALRATMRPQTTSYLFFVSRNDGTHVFTEKYEDHARAVRDFQMNAKAREGKSWRDLEKTKAPGP